MGSNPFDLRRYADIFSGGQQPDPLMKAYRGVNFNTPQQDMSSGPIQSNSRDDPFLQALNRIQTGKASEAYRQHVGNMPNPQDYKPSKWRRLGAALTAGAASFGKTPQNAMELGEMVRDAPLRGAMSEWQLKGAGLKEQADMEGQDVKGQIEQLKAYREHMAGLRKTEVDEFTAKSQHDLRVAQIAKLKNEGWVEFTDEQGMLRMVNPTTKEERDFGPTIETTKISERKAAQKNQDRRTDIFGNVANSLIDQRGAVAPEDTFTSDAMAIQRVLRTHPEWSGWVNPDGTIKRKDDYYFHDPTKDPNYRAFLEAVEAEGINVRGTRRPGTGASRGGLSMTPQGSLQLPVLNFDDLDDREE